MNKNNKFIKYQGNEKLKASRFISYDNVILIRISEILISIFFDVIVRISDLRIRISVMRISYIKNERIQITKLKYEILTRVHYNKDLSKLITLCMIFWKSLRISCICFNLYFYVLIAFHFNTIGISICHMYCFTVFLIVCIMIYQSYFP